MRASAQPSYHFGPFVLDPTEKVLLRDGHPINLPLKALETLLVLVEKPGHVLEKSEILERVWPNTFVEEATLAQNIFTLRKALGDSPQGHKYIETVPKRGYRMVAPVSTASAQQLHTQAKPVSLRYRLLGWSLVAILLAFSALGLYFRGRHLRPLSPSPGRIMLAVLPFENLSGDPKQDFLGDGLTEEMIAQLSRLNPARLGVIARTSAMHYKGTSESVAQIGRELGVDYVLESSFRREGNNVRITTQLVRVSDQTHLWSQSYERAVREILPLETEITGVIAHEIEVNLSAQSQAHLSGSHPADPEAYELYLEGRYFWNKRNSESLHKAVMYFERAIARDPQFAVAYSGLADSYSLGEYFQDMAAADRSAKAKAAAEKALQLDDTLAEAHVSMTLAGGWTQAPQQTEDHFKRALELNPNYATAHHWYSLFLKDTGRIDEALPEIERARELDPLSLVINADQALVMYFDRHYDEAISQCRKTLEMDPNFRLAHWELGMAYEEKHMYAEAVKEYETAVQLAPDYPLMSAYLARAYALTGRRNEALKILHQLEHWPAEVEPPIGAMAAIYSALGDKDRAFVWLERAYRAREVSLPWSVRLDPRWDDLRTDPRFQDLVVRTSLAGG